ncbi:hypothetical protein [Alkalibaculum bacchi]|uniref:hypothetical protein n=1 Tax=Alkalibaculum bacchi TaxID=645887 RepID=UPI0026EB2033|nr:hypothetical protein [Alkalibaculum bacchi]
MVEIKPRKKTSGELVTSINSKQLDFQYSNLDDLFDKFVIFIDGSPEMIMKKTYQKKNMMEKKIILIIEK